jgi:hypothetical protein
MYHVTLSTYICNTYIITNLCIMYLIALNLWFWEVLEDFMRKVVEFNFIGFVMQQSCGEQIVLGFSFYQLVDGLVHKLIQAEW